MRNEVHVSSFHKNFRRHETDLEDIAHLVLKYLKKTNIGVDVFLVGNPRMRELNKSALGKDRSTNVLAFEAPAFPNPSAPCKPVGEVYLCPPYIDSHGEDLEYMLIHGLLHLFGFLHETKSDRIVMENAESDIIAFVRRQSKKR